MKQMTTAELLSALVTHIERAGGPNEVRFVPVTRQALEGAATTGSSELVFTRLSETEDGLAEITFTRPSPPFP